MWYESITVRSWRMAAGVALLVGLVLATLPVRPTLAVNSTGDTGATRTINPPYDPPVTPCTQSIDGFLVKAEEPHGTGSAYNPASAQSSTSCYECTGCDYTRNGSSFYGGRCVCVDRCVIPQAKPTVGASDKAATMADQYWSWEGMVNAPHTYYVGLPQPWEGMVNAPYMHYVGMPQPWDTGTG